MPWAKLVADVALEIDPDTREWAYPVVILEVPRQAGKTSVTQTNSAHRALTGMDRGVWYTAQSRQDARDNWLTLIKRVRRTPIGPPFSRIRESNGSEGISFPNGSEYRIFAPVPEALHGKATDLVTVDEAWKFDEVRGDELIQAIVPTFSTRPGQLWVPSAAGTHRSTWFRGLCDAGRLAVEAGRTSGIAFFSWGIDEGVDPGDLGAVALAHPGYGYTLRPAGLVQAASIMKPHEFARAYGSRWTGVSERAIPALLWAAAEDVQGPPIPAGRQAFALGFDVGLDGEDAAIVLAWRDDAGVARVELADVRDGAAWLTGRCVQLVTDHDPVAVAYDHYGPAVAAADAGRRAGLEYAATTTDDYVVACGGFLAELAAGTIKVRPHPALDAAAAGAAKKRVGDRWVWGRRASTSTIAPLVAATIALWAFDHAPRVEPFAVR
jgi:hypothetical protein